MVFFMGGPQLGEMEAGAVAQLWGPTVSVVTGGFGCLVATAVVAAAEPALRHYRKGADHAVQGSELISDTPQPLTPKS
jgi:hypothetical protein